MVNTFPGSRALILQSFASRLAPDIACPTILASLADSTLKQYNAPLKAWWIYCQSTNTPVFSPNITQALTFLTKELQRVGSYASLNTTRSAISLLSPDQIGNHALVKRFCKGASVLKPTAPRYDMVWDPEPVIAKLSKQQPHSKLSLEELTKKLVLLLALATGQRAQTLSLFKRAQITNLPNNKMVIRIPDSAGTGATVVPILVFLQQRKPVCRTPNSRIH